MPKQTSNASDLRGFSKMTIDAIVGIADLAEAVHMNILDQVAKFGVPARKPLSGAAALIYRSVRGITQWVGGGIDFALERLTPLLGKSSTWPGRESLLAALNGVLGDYLAARANPLAITMTFRSAGQPLKLEKQALAAAFPAANGRILVLAHGLCMNDLQWNRNGHDHGAALARDLGYTPLYLHYNSGLHISTNGREFAQQLETLLREWPVAVEELAILGHSMGGLVARSAYRYGATAKMRWTKCLSKLVFLGTPHHGAPLERGGNWFHLLTDISSYTAPFSNLGKIRSAGITDLRYGNLLDTDWESVDRFAHVGDLRTPVSLPAKVPCFALAATTGKQAGDISDRLLGDGLVPLESALGRHANPSLNLEIAPDHQWIGYGINHLDLLSRPEVYQQLLQWL
jgi:pimeloyl-ACP methyl ester carboxylesterase